ncbi:type IVB secretion system protein IcmH/DotU [Rubrivirga sp. IMCC45206]|uniref:type IVB secretion system protein IcmH/DotU n=1 Tax=Rubrivirga sp. IMCC45206 TaxID=3391614 RepID=UPI00399033C3
MADDPRNDDDATRIYRPYGSPPPDDGSDPLAAPPDGDGGTDPFAPEADPFAPAAPDPFAAPDTADPFASPAASDPFAAPAASDPFAPPPASDPFAAPAASDPFASRPDAGAAAPDPFSTSAPDPSASPAAPDPFAPADDPVAPATSDPFAPAASPSTPDPFAPPAGGADPFAPAGSPPAPDPFAPAPGAADPFGPAGDDPFRAPAAPAPDPFAPPPPAAHAPPTAPPPRPADDTFAPRAPDPYRAGPADPFAPAPTPAPRAPAERADPFAPVAQVGAGADPFADLQGPSLGGPASFDSGIREGLRESDALLLPAAFGAERSLAGAFTPVFSLVLQLRASDHLGDPTDLRTRIESMLREAAAAAREAGAADGDVEEATEAMVAFLDEAVLGSAWPGRDAWASEPLQLTHYDRNDLGERFFDRLKRVLDEGAVRRDVLEVYYLCLALGFKGRYAIHGREVLRRLVTDLHERLSNRTAPGALAPRGHSREVPAEAEKGGIPTWALWAGAAALVLLLYLGLSLSLSAAATDAVDALRALSDS